MPMHNSLLRPVSSTFTAILQFILTTLAGEPLTDQTGDPLRTIQDA
jgi:hypothetical protein